VGIEFKNNIVTIKRGGNAVKNAVYIDNTTSSIIADYNDYYVSGSNAHIGFYPTTNRTTLAQWQAALPGQETHSLNTDPLYQNPATQDYRPSIQTVDNLGTSSTSVAVSTDIKGIFRNSPPDMGAFEFVPIPCGAPVAGTASVNPLSNICLQDPITLDITGHSQLGTLTFQWEASANGTSGWAPISPILFGPQFNTTMTPNTYFRARVACGATGVYTNVVHVTLNSVVMQGTYTIGNGVTTWNGTPPVAGVNDNFATFQEAVSGMQCGITGPIVFNVKTGTYTEQIRINNIRNTSAVNTVTFQAATGVAADANLTFNSTTGALNYTLKLDSTQYFTFRNMTISATNTSFGRVVEIANTASYDSIVRCNIVAPVVASTANTASAIYANAVRGTNLILKKNNITNGANGIYFTGTSTTVLALPGHLIDSNTVSGSFHTGILVQNANDMMISGNTVNLTGPIGANAAGINTNRVDSGYRIQNNTVTINNSTVAVYGIYVQNAFSAIGDSGIIRSNRVIADAGNTGIVYGMTITNSKNLYIVNNTAGINTTGVTSAAYGFHSLTNSETVNWYNNSAQITSGSTNGYAAYFNHAVGGTRVYNNIFANKGGGRAMYVNNPGNFFGDYNMLYTSGANLVQSGTGAPVNFTSLLQWKNSWNWDRHSLTGRPKFVSNTDLRPDIAQDSSWMMHGRGVQIPGNAYDFNGNYRPQTLTEGVPDLGAYEFHPTVDPTVLAASPAVPAPGVEQTFYYGSDTVMRIKWGATAPPAIEVKRFSGDVPPGLQTPPNSPRPDSMFFHTTVDIPSQPLSANKFPFEAKLYYVESWMGSIPEEYMIGMGRKLESNSYVVGYNSQNNLITNEISQKSLNYFNIFTGLINPAAQRDSDDSTSNRGKDFWVGYQRTNGFSQGNVQEMVLYFGANSQQAHVTVTIEGTSGTPWIRNYTVPPNSTIQSDLIPKAGADDARLPSEGLWDNKGIHIVSDVPVVAYAHIYENTNSGATMLMPTTVWGYEYFTLNNRQSYGAAGGIPAATVFHVIAKEDSTWVEINPTKATTGGWTPNGGTQPNGSYLVKLNKGDVYEVIGGVLAGTEGLDLTGSIVKSIGNNQGQCFPIAVFSGSTRTAIGCGATLGSNGDLIIQQIFPYQAWGTKYATAPPSLSTGPNAGTDMTTIFRVMVKDPTTIVKRNTIPLTAATYNAIGHYYQFESTTGDYIEANKPILVAQYMPSSNGFCNTTDGIGDPEMFILSPLQQAIRSTQLYRNVVFGINVNFITLVIPTEGLTSLRIDGVNWQTYPATDVFAKNHPNLTGYSIVTKRWAGGAGNQGSSIVESDLPFTGIVYGEGGAESYGYNLGTLVRNLNNLSIVDNVLDPNANATGYTCKNAPFTLQVLLPIVPDSIRWHLSALPWFNPHVDSVQHNPVSSGTITVDGIQYYIYTLNQSFTSDSANNNGFIIPITYWSPELESCDKSRTGSVFVTVLPAPQTDFSVAFSGGNPQACEGDIATFTAQDVTANGVAVNQWDWTFHTGATASGQIQTFTYPAPGTYPVKLKGITGDGCISDTIKNVVVNPKPPVTVSSANLSICPGDNAVMSVSAPLAGATYNWYNVATGGTILGTGTTFTATGVTPPASFWVEGISSAGCKSVTRAKVDVTTLPQLAQPVVTVTGNTATSVTFGWTAIAGAAGYQVSTNAGGTWITPSSGATGTSHTVTGLGTVAQTCILVRVLGTLTCQTNTSASVCGCSNSSAVVITPVVSVCTGASASFTIQSPVGTVTYNWYSAATGGTLLGTGTTFNSPNVSGSTNYYVEQVGAAGCTGSPRTQVTANILPPLTVPNLLAPFSLATVNSITWTWAAVPGAASYQVSLDNGATWITPSSGATGLSHIISGLPPVTHRCIMVRAIGTIACQTSQSVSVCGDTKPDAVFIPNTFTPNGDGKNDALVVYGWAIQSIQFMVFNQWGEKIHELSTTAQDGSTGGFNVWDGKYKGKVQPVGVYVYTAKITLKDGNVIEKSGPLNIIR
jgi:gliding motility-associated-like protein